MVNWLLETQVRAIGLTDWLTKRTLDINDHSQLVQLTCFFFSDAMA